MSSILVYNGNLTLLGILDEYVEAIETINYYDNSTLEISVPFIKGFTEMLLPPLNEDIISPANQRILVFQDDLSTGYMVENFVFSGSTSKILTLYCFELTYALDWRIVHRQIVFDNEYINQVTKKVIEDNVTLASNTSRRLSNFEIHWDLYDDDELTTSFDPGVLVGESLRRRLSDYQVGIRTIIDYNEKKFKFKTFKGVNRTSDKLGLTPVLFSEDAGNVISWSYSQDRSNFKNSSFVKAEGNTNNIYRFKNIGSSNNSWNKRELFVDASDFQQTYTDENGDTIVLTNTQFYNGMDSIGVSELQNRNRIKELDALLQVHDDIQFNRDFFIGDIITVSIESLNLTLNQRVVSAQITRNANGKNVNIALGSKIPSMIEKVKWR